MNRFRHAILVPLLAVLALLCGLAGTASAAFNPAAKNPNFREFLLQKSEASTSEWVQPTDPARGNGEWIYDSTLGVPAYVRQNPWTFFDPEGLDMKRAGDNLDSALRAIEGMFTRNPSEGMEAGAKLIEAAMEVVDSGIDKISGNARGGENAVEYAAGFNPVVAAGETAQEIDEKGVSAGVVAVILIEKTVGKIPGLKGKGDDIVDSARGVQKKAAAAVERAKNLEKGIPASHLGPSGKPKVHVVKKPTDKQAKDAARQHGKSKPEKHTQDAGQPTHYHGTDSTGEKLKGKDNVHFQKRGEKPNPPKEEKVEP